jgi:hypothetical protein
MRGDTTTMRQLSFLFSPGPLMRIVKEHLFQCFEVDSPTSDVIPPPQKEKTTIISRHGTWFKYIVMFCHYYYFHMIDDHIHRSYDFPATIDYDYINKLRKKWYIHGDEYRNLIHDDPYDKEFICWKCWYYGPFYERED